MDPWVLRLKCIDVSLAVNFKFTQFKPAVVYQLSFTRLVINFGSSAENSSSPAVH